MFNGKKKKQPKWSITETEDTIEVHGGKNIFLLPRESIEGLVQWMLEGNENNVFNDNNIEGMISNGEITLRDQVFQPMSFTMSDVPWFLSLIGVEIERAEDNEDDELSEIQSLVAESENPTLEDIYQEAESDEILGSFDDSPIVQEADKLSKKIHEIAKSAKTGITPMKPMILPVYRLAYIDCQCSMTIKVGANSTYNGSAVVCPGCQAIILLLDSEE